MTDFQDLKRSNTIVGPCIPRECVLCGAVYASPPSPEEVLEHGLQAYEPWSIATQGPCPNGHTLSEQVAECERQFRQELVSEYDPADASDWSDYAVEPEL